MSLVIYGSRYFLAAGGGDSPASGHSGINLTTQEATDDVVIIDLREPLNTYTNVQWAEDTYPTGTVGRAATITYQAGGGYYGQGCARFVPGWMHGDPGDPAGEHMCSIGQLLGWNAVAPGGSCTKVTVGALVRYGTSYWTTGQRGKSIILLRTGTGGGDTRPMVLARGSTQVGFGPCDGTLGNYNTDPQGTDFFNEDGGPAPNQLNYEEQWQWVQFEVDLDVPTGVGEGRVLLWTEDGTVAGTPILRNDYTEDVGGTIPGADGIHGWVNSWETIDSNYWHEIEYIEIWIGQSTGMTPPVGFPGSAR